MQRRMSSGFSVVSLVSGAVSLLIGTTLACGQETSDLRSPIANLSRYDLATPEELLYAHWLTPFVKSENTRDWRWVREFVDHTGKWVGAYVDAHKLAVAIQEGMATQGQPPLKKLDDLVAECADRLGVKKPTVIVRNDPHCQAYLVDAHREQMLVLSSGMLELFDGADEELRFVVGRELGHLKCGHLPLRRAALGLITILGTVNTRVVPDEAQVVLPTLLVGRMMTWLREAEISADRAGLLCCDRPQTAYNALGRLLHGLAPKVQILDADHPDVNPEEVVRRFERWEQEPLYRFITFLQREPRTTPFVAQRMAALRVYASSAAYRQLAQLTSPSRKLLVVVEELEVLGLAAPGKGIYPYVVCQSGGKAVFRTPTKSYGDSAKWKKITVVVSEEVGQPVFFEVWNDGWRTDERIGGFVLYPGPSDLDQKQETEVLTAPLQWDWDERSTETRAGVARVAVRFAKIGGKP